MNPSGVKHSGSKIILHSDFQAGSASEDPCKVYNIIWSLNEVDYEGNWKTIAQDRVTWCLCPGGNESSGFIMLVS